MKEAPVSNHPGPELTESMRAGKRMNLHVGVLPSKFA